MEDWGKRGGLMVREGGGIKEAAVVIMYRCRVCVRLNCKATKPRERVKCLWVRWTIE